jgi:thioredoxin reductase (NADPH)
MPIYLSPGRSLAGTVEAVGNDVTGFEPGGKCSASRRARSQSTRKLDRLVGAGVFYGAAGVMASAVAGEDVFVVGGANSAGQAALHLAKYAGRVTLLVRGSSLAAGMSDYLVRQIEATPNVAVRLGTRVVGGRGSARLESLILARPQRSRRVAA